MLSKLTQSNPELGFEIHSKRRSSTAQELRAIEACLHAPMRRSLPIGGGRPTPVNQAGNSLSICLHCLPPLNIDSDKDFLHRITINLFPSGTKAQLPGSKSQEPGGH